MAQDLLYNRSARIRVGNLGGDGKDFTGLRVQFSVEKTSESNANSSKITIYNLNPDSRSFLEQQNLTVILEVGYEPPGQDPFLEILAVGDIKRGKVKNERQGTDWVSTLELGDGEVALQEKFFNKSFEPGASLEKVMKDVAGSFDKPVNTIIGLKDKVFNSGLNLSGGSKEILDTLTRDAGLEWSIQDDEVQILPPEGSTTDEILLLTPQTGLLSSPIKREKGVEFMALINPSLRPGRRFRLESRDIKGVFRARKVFFNGDTLEGDWTMKVEAV